MTFLANAQFVVAIPRNSVGIVLSVCTVALLAVSVSMILQRYLLPSLSIITTTSPTSFRDGGALNWLVLDVIVSASDAVQVVPPVNVIVVALVFWPSYVDPQSTKNASSGKSICLLLMRSIKR